MKFKLACIAAAASTGVLCAAVVLLFSISVDFLSSVYQDNMWLVWLLPLSGLLTYTLYRLCKIPFDVGTISVVEDIKAEVHISPALAPAIFGGTCLSIIGGASVGKEAAALQMGASISSIIGKAFGLNAQGLDRLLASCAMASALSALFGTPLASIVFVFELFRESKSTAIELCCVTIASFISWALSFALSADDMRLSIYHVPLNVELLLPIGVLFAASCLVGCMFCFALYTGRKLLRGITPVFLLLAGGFVYAGLVTVFDGYSYSGTGMNQVVTALSGTFEYPYFVGKIACTVFVLMCGFKGGEIMPTLAIGATLGAYIGPLIGTDPSFAAAFCMVVLFATCTNCPLSACLLGAESFGFTYFPLFFVATLFTFFFTSRIGFYGNVGSLKSTIVQIRSCHKN